ncbi:MAG: DUF1571 domain-containing protein [Planctomycetales bacterium]|nr:DUF1571 domain-containing protein [Planctomycetales bacterium]
MSPRAASELAFSGLNDSARGKRSFGSLASKQALPGQESQHPLRPLLVEARQALAYIEQEVHDYTCNLVKRERIEGKLLPQETLFAKVLHGNGELEDEASSSDCIYLRFDSPATVSGREILFKLGGEPSKLLVRNGGHRLAFLTLELDPTCALAMRGTRYPVTEFGIKRLVERMIRLGEKELEHAECEVRTDEQATLDGRRCRCIEVLHPQRRDYFAFHLARIYIDEELQLPVRFEAYDWPTEPGAEPPVLEEYSYRNIQLNVGLGIDDFRRNNPEYSFSRR